MTLIQMLIVVVVSTLSSVISVVRSNIDVIDQSQIAGNIK
jgi:hypothetical protein